MKCMTRLAELGLLPDRLIRAGIRGLHRRRLRSISLGNAEARLESLQRFLEAMKRGPVAPSPQSSNRQHYEIPPEFFRMVLGKRLKYSSCYWPPGILSLDGAEEAMLDLTCRRAEIEDGMDVLELGCGWGALSLWIAEKHPRCRILAVSNSRLQADFIRSMTRERDLSRVEVRTADMNRFSTDGRYDRVVSIEMFEHMRNWEELLRRISRWLKPDGKLFIHIFSHLTSPYAFESEGEDNWMGRHFFTGGIMPSDSLLLYMQKDLLVERHWRMNGKHYARTLEAWLGNMDARREAILPVLAGAYGDLSPKLRFQRWRIFMMACAELFAHGKGEEWLVSHYLLKQRAAQAGASLESDNGLEC